MKQEDHSNDEDFGPHTHTHTNFHAISAFLIFVAGITLFALGVGNDYKMIDSVALYSFQSKVPSAGFLNTWATARGTAVNGFPPEVIRFAGQMLDTCYLPDLFDALYKTDTSVNANAPKDTDANVYLTDTLEQARVNSAIRSLQDVIPGWGRPGVMTDGYVGAGKNAPVYNMQALPPICRCFHSVLQKYKASPAMNFGQINAPLKACIVTQQAIPSVTLTSNSGDNNKQLESRKFITRHGMLLILAMGYALDYILSHMSDDVPRNNSNQLMTYLCKWFSIFVLFVMMWVIPVVEGNGNQSLTQNIIGCTSLLLLPPALIYVVLTIAEHLMLNRTERVRARRFLHPFTFTVTLSVLSVVSFLENGVFIFDHFVVRALHSVAIGLMYAGVVVFTVMDNEKVVSDVSSENRGVLIYIIVSILLVGAYVVPFFPTNCELNLLWILPILYTLVTFLTTALHSAYDVKNETRDMLPHLQKATHAAILMYLILYFITQRAYVEIGNHFVNAGALSYNLNFALSTAANDAKYAIP